MFLSFGRYFSLQLLWTSLLALFKMKVYLSDSLSGGSWLWGYDSILFEVTSCAYQSMMQSERHN